MTAGVQEQHSVLKIILSPQQICINWLHSVRSCPLTLKQFDLMPKANTATIYSRFRTEAELDFLVWLTAVAKSWLPFASFLLTLYMHGIFKGIFAWPYIFCFSYAVTGHNIQSTPACCQWLPDSSCNPGRAKSWPETMSSRSSVERAYLPWGATNVSETPKNQFQMCRVKEHELGETGEQERQQRGIFRYK